MMILYDDVKATSGKYGSQTQNETQKAAKSANDHHDQEQ
jgi:hypothetical protein